jgi:hypothetical protein
MSERPVGGPKPKQKYEKPRIKSESLTVVAALCNGTATGGRKASTGAPSFCNSARIKS